MSRDCIVCKKQTVAGNAVSHSNLKVRRTWKANLQRVRILVKGVPTRAYVCTRCLKSGKVTRAI
jgi:large subunit ribosomal protein L28